MVFNIKYIEKYDTYDSTLPEIIIYKSIGRKG